MKDRWRRPERSVLYAVLREHLEIFLAWAEARGRPAPRFVERELRGFLDCGILAHGFLRVRCPACRQERLVAFSCKSRGFCPSCGGRRMAETAAHLIDHVLPRAPVRQWVLTLPFALRYRMAYDAKLLGEVSRLFVRAVFASYRRRARVDVPHPDRPRCGAVTFVQRFGDALNLNVHFHTLVLDGVYRKDPQRGPLFLPLPPPCDEEVEAVALRIVRRLVKQLERLGLGRDDDDPDPLPRDEPMLAELYAASVRGLVAIWVSAPASVRCASAMRLPRTRSPPPPAAARAWPE